jgi:branched-subunit amino acid transport protein
MTTWIAVLGVGLGSYLLRAVPLLVLDRVDMPARTEQLLSRAGLAAITALIALSTRSAASGRATPAVAAIAVGAVLAHRKASMLHVVLAGAAMYAAIRLGIAAGG